MYVHNRRTFLKCAGAAAVGLGLPGYATADNTPFNVRLEAPDTPLTARVFDILSDRIQQRCAISPVKTDDNAQLILALDSALAHDAFRIDQAGAALRISGGSPQGLLYGTGKFLRTSQYGPTFQPSTWRGTSAPHSSLRGMYFASHFHNWYCQASQEEIARYMEDLALWGVNAIKAIFPMINLQDWNDPQAEPAMAMLRQYAKTAHDLGIQFVTGLNNAMFIGTPQSIRATPRPDPGCRGNSGNLICPSNSEGHAYLMENSRILFEKLADIGLDAIDFWPYDEGGCACEQCRPWGSNGYLKLSRDMAQLARRYFPKIRTILSTWLFDMPPEGEWQGLADALEHGNDWLDYILADSPDDFPRYPLEHPIPGKLPLLNFPEISMWGNSIWGGYGANVLPTRCQRLWDQVKQTVQGGFPYSEGIYEDINKAIVVQFYWDRDQTAQATLREYAAYEFGAGVEDDTLALIDLLETNASKRPVNRDDALRAYQYAGTIHQRIPDWAKKNWRWEILHLRAILDRERFAGDGEKTQVSQDAFLRLIEIYHSQIETDDPYHHRVRPPLARAISRHGEC